MSLHTKKLLKTTVLIISGLIINQLLVNHITITSNLNASALDYQSNPVTLDFTFGSTLSITTDGDITIPNLTPGTKSISDSNYKVTVSTNNTTGYTLAATVGCSSGANCYNTKNLVDSNNDDTTTNNFTMIDSATTLTTPGTWGISLDSTADENSTFDTLPLYSATAKIINQTTSATGTAANGYTGTNNTTMRIGAYATTSQMAGTYTNTINFIAVANTVPKAYMQDQTTESLAALLPYNGSTATLYDKRDDQEYSIAKINGAYWMTRNLAIGCNGSGSTYGNTMTSVALDSTNSNVTNTSNSPWNTPTLSLDSTDETTGCTTSDTSSCNSYTDARMKCSSDYGAWYNYAAATANTVTGASNTMNATQDICPTNWHLPSGPSTIANTDFSRLLNNTASGYYEVPGLVDAFSPVIGGGFRNGSLHDADLGFWWSTTTLTATTRYYLGYNGSNGRFSGYNDFYRYFGYFVRCVRSS